MKTMAVEEAKKIISPGLYDHSVELLVKRDEKGFIMGTCFSVNMYGEFMSKLTFEIPVCWQCDCNGIPESPLKTLTLTCKEFPEKEVEDVKKFIRDMGLPVSVDGVPVDGNDVGVLFGNYNEEENMFNVLNGPKIVDASHVYVAITNEFPRWGQKDQYINEKYSKKDGYSFDEGKVQYYRHAGPNVLPGIEVYFDFFIVPFNRNDMMKDLAKVAIQEVKKQSERDISYLDRRISPIWDNTYWVGAEPLFRPRPLAP